MLQLQQSKEIDVRVFSNQVGVFESFVGNMVRTGLGTGSSDIIGIIAPSGRFLSAEIKLPHEFIRVAKMITGTIKMTPHIDDQYRWLKMVNRMGGVGLFACTAEQIIDAIRSAS